MISEKAKIFILVKTYPVLSKKYSELVCTAGIKEDGSWVRIYPVPFRFLEYEKRYKKYQWVETTIKRNESDPRPESYKIVNPDQIELLQTIDTKNQWQERKNLLFSKCTVYHNLDELITIANKNTLSLAMFKPATIDEFIVENSERDWPKDIMDKILHDIKQPDLFSTDEENQAKETFQLVKKLPYKFSYKFTDKQGKESKLMIEDWEIGQLYWNCLKQANGDESKAVELVRKKYWDEFQKKNIYLFLGTTRQYHGWAKNPFVIIGVFYPPKVKDNFDLFSEAPSA